MEAATKSFLIAVTLLAIVPLPTALLAQPPPRPFLMVHYMPWFQSKPYEAYWGWHWTMNHFNPDIIDGQGRRQIASHYYPLVGPYDSRDPDLIEYHVLLMKVAGIDGAIADWDGTSSLYDYALIHQGTRRLFDALSGAGLRFAVCYEDQSITQLINNGWINPTQAIGRAQQDMLFVRDVWANQPTYLTLQGMPVILNFGPQYFYTESEWTSIFSVYSVAPQFFPINYRLGTVAAGAFSWPPMWMSGGGVLTPESLYQYLDDFYARGAMWPSVVGGAFPGFHDIYAEAGVGASYGCLDARDGLTFSETVARAVSAQSPIIQLVTWNDFGEGTNIEPTLEYGYRYLEHVQDVARGFRSLPYTGEDLTLPYTIHTLRKQYVGDANVKAQLDQAAAFIISGQPGEARAILDAIQLTATEPGSIPVPKLALAIRPNPTVTTATILFDLPRSGEIHLDVFDVTGRRVIRLASDFQALGRHGVVWDARRYPSGVYLVRLQMGREAMTRSVLVQH